MPRLEVQADVVADLDRRLGQIDSTIEEAAKRGRTDGALSAIDGRRKARQALPRRPRDVLTLADLEPERATLGAAGPQNEVEAAPVRHGEPTGADTDGEWAVRWLLALMVLSPAIALAAAESAQNRPQSSAA